MEQWAANSLFAAGADFYCVCVDSLDVALNFHKLFRFTKAVNVWIPSRAEMPDYGQLGCSGFIVVGADGKCVSRATAAMLRVGPDAAFADAEQVIRLALKKSTVPAAAMPMSSPTDHAYAVGRIVRIDGLASAPELNGMEAVIIRFEATSGRFIVEIQTVQQQRRLAVQPCNLAPVITADTAAVPPSLISFVPAPPLIGNAAIDSEHAECATALSALLAAGPNAPPSVLVTACKSLEDHFEHEEELAIAANFGGSTGSDVRFSAFGSHAVDHARILRIARDALARANGNGFVDNNDARSIAEAFVTHARDFDVLLEGQLHL